MKQSAVYTAWSALSCSMHLYGEWCLIFAVGPEDELFQSEFWVIVKFQELDHRLLHSSQRLTAVKHLPETRSFIPPSFQNTSENMNKMRHSLSRIAFSLLIGSYKADIQFWYFSWMLCSLGWLMTDLSSVLVAAPALVDSSLHQPAPADPGGSFSTASQLGP